LAKYKRLIILKGRHYEHIYGRVDFDSTGLARPAYQDGSPKESCVKLTLPPTICDLNFSKIKINFIKGDIL